MKKVAIFGSTGSIGTNTLNVIRENRDLFTAVTLVAGKNVEKLIEQIDEFKPQNVYIRDKANADILREKYRGINVFYGDGGMDVVSNLDDFDIGVSALVGVAGLKPTYNMIKKGKIIALANKEVLVAGGKLIIDLAASFGSTLLTVDSEHSAIMQCLNGEDHDKIDKILLTASGGPFFDRKIDEKITVEEALLHPTWSMGKKITIDSATMMNKGFEVIEAKWLFNVDPSKIQVVVHRGSLVHSMVQFVDGTIMASIGPKSMQIPIAYALNYPNRLPNSVEKLDLFKIKTLTFEEPDMNKFKCLRLAYETINAGHSYQIALNAANEVLVDSFLNRRVKFTDIPNGIEYILNIIDRQEIRNIEDVLNFDKEIREKTYAFLEELYGNAQHTTSI